MVVVTLADPYHGGRSSGVAVFTRQCREVLGRLLTTVCVVWWLQEDRQLLEEQEAVLEAVNVVDHDIDVCVQTLERIYGQKLDRLTKFGGKDQ